MRTVERGKAAAKKSPGQAAEKAACKVARKAAKATVSRIPRSPDTLTVAGACDNAHSKRRCGLAGCCRGR
jgi:hypothetical protein